MIDLAGPLIVGAVTVFVAIGIQRMADRSRAYALTEPQKTPWLGGSEPETHAWQRFHVRYYSMALLFIAFEMEMIFMYPWAVVYVTEGGKALMEMGMFLVILAIGIVYAWREGVFRWQ